MTIVEAVNAAKASLMAMYDEHLPDWEDAPRRLAYIDATEQVFEHLDVALRAATTPEAMGCVIDPAEDGTSPATATHG